MAIQTVGRPVENPDDIGIITVRTIDGAAIKEGTSRPWFDFRNWQMVNLTIPSAGGIGQTDYQTIQLQAVLLVNAVRSTSIGIAIDDIQVSNYPCGFTPPTGPPPTTTPPPKFPPSPFDCDFENSTLCNWTTTGMSGGATMFGQWITVKGHGSEIITNLPKGE